MNIIMSHCKCLISYRHPQRAVWCHCVKHRYRRQHPQWQLTLRWQLATLEHCLITTRTSLAFLLLSIQSSRALTAHPWNCQSSLTYPMLLSMTFSSRGKSCVRQKVKIGNLRQQTHFFKGGDKKLTHPGQRLNRRFNTFTSYN